MMPEAYKLVRYLSHNNLANNKRSKVDYYMYAYRLEIIRNLMKWFSFFFIVLTKVPTTVPFRLIRPSRVTRPVVLAEFGHLSRVTTPMADDFWWIQKKVKKAFKNIFTGVEHM